MAWIRRRAPAPPTSGSLGVGDDTAVLPVNRGKLLITTDMLVAGVDFLPGADPRNIGWKSLAASLSDVAAMGGRPRWAVAALALPRRSAALTGRGILGGMLALAKRRDVLVVGGDLSRTAGPVVVSVTVVGIAPRRPVLRSGARAGDLIGVTGTLGMAALGLRLARSGACIPGARGLARRLLLAQLRPDPDPALGPLLGRFATAMIDVSDGLSTDLAHLCRESGVGAVVDAALLPLPPEAAGPPRQRLAAALHGGEDFCLLLTYPARTRRHAEVAGARTIGEISAGKSVLLRRDDGTVAPLSPGGFQHF